MSLTTIPIDTETRDELAKFKQGNGRESWNNLLKRLLLQQDNSKVSTKFLNELVANQDFIQVVNKIAKRNPLRGRANDG